MRDGLDLNAVRVYAAVVDEQSFAGAARLLAIPRPTSAATSPRWSAGCVSACWNAAPATCA
ncbi:Transcriptional regulator, LysR family [Labilithrix luteola]|uniref:Transcriptional regulator, LysR family n=1 Tax=Labilithrix luteola TaxID=1391654 RepID=A0A0K1PQ52_9BACT|nr:Transcriptional regulator, LysR family [Labilithrix luteola]